MDAESVSERQENEVEVLCSIYSCDFVDMRLANKKVGFPPELKITLRPQQSMTAKAAHASIDLIVKCPLLYPDEIPELFLENVKGLSTNQTSALKLQLEQLAKELKGEVMILELCQHVEKYLHANNKPPALSFYEQMMSNQKSKEERMARENQRLQDLLSKKEKQEAQEIEEEIERNIINVRNQHKQIRGISECSADIELPNTKHRRQSFSSPDNLLFDNESDKTKFGKVDTSTVTRYNESIEKVECHCHDVTEEMVLSTKKKSFYKGHCLGHSSNYRSSYIGILRDTGNLALVTEWTANRDMEINKEQESSSYIEKLTEQTLQEFIILTKLHHHNLAHYLDFGYYGERGRFTACVLSEYIEGTPLKMWLERRQPMPLEQVYWIAGQIVDALIYLHDKNVVHKDLRSSCIFLDKFQCIKLTKYSFHRRLTEIMQEAGCQLTDNKEASTVSVRGKKGDIYRLGWIIQCLASGEMKPERCVPIKSPSSSFDDFISRCIDEDEKRRLTAKQLREHAFLKEFIPSPLAHDKDQFAALYVHKDLKMQDDSMDPGIIPYIPTADNGSRLTNEFDILAFIGKGGFGDVIKVRNKLDGQLYAIKRILLSAERKHVTKKITREVKLLSRLNNEYVVRYYNSWIETTEGSIGADISTTLSSISPTEKSKLFNPVNTFESIAYDKNLKLNDDIEKFAPPEVEKSIEWSISVLSKGREKFESESDSSDDDDNNLFGTSVIRARTITDEDSIMFEKADEDSASPVSEEKTEDKFTTNSDKSAKQHIFKRQFLYIQMEFCEKNTLRDCIDSGVLHKDAVRCWRLLREVVEGLVHMHGQGMIHRDLKPTNIFLTLDDHVKIGDFGLATSEVTQAEIGVVVSSQSEQSSNLSRSDGAGDGDGHTGKVGTALYASPEILGIIHRSHYNQKVDMYSLGVMFFEMCYRPFSTGMERVTILTNIRKNKPEYPEDFNEDIKLMKQKLVINWLLNHDPDKRPTSKELLQSEYMPPLQVEEEELREILRSTLGDRKSTSFRRVLQTLFSQPCLPSHYSVMYDKELYKNKLSEELLLAQMQATDMIEKVFQKHGAIKIATQLLIPKSQFYESNEGCVYLMDHTGTVLMLPYDSQVSFARYVAHRGITQLKRYSFDRVFRENRLITSAIGLHPREIYACSFDIVCGSTEQNDVSDTLDVNRLLPETEVLTVVYEIIKECSSLRAKNFIIRFNHARLLKAILLHCGIVEHHNEIIAILNAAKGDEVRTRTRTRLCSLALIDSVVDSFCKFLDMDGPFDKVASQLRCITKLDGSAGQLAKRALREIENVINNMEALGIKVQAYLTVSLVYNISRYSGILFQLVASTKNASKKGGTEILAAGGRYDRLVKDFTKLEAVFSPGIVGVNIAVDRVSAALLEDRVTLYSYNVLVSPLGNNSLPKDKFSIALGIMRDLWAAGIKAHMNSEAARSLEELQEFCLNKGISHLIILKELETGIVKIRSFEKGLGIERKIAISYIAEYLQQKSSTEYTDTIPLSHKQQPIVFDQSAPASVSVSASNVSYNINFLLQEDGSKLAKNAKRQFEAQIQSGVSNMINLLSPKVKIEIIAVELEAAVIRTIVAHLELYDEQLFRPSCAAIIEKHPRHRKYLERIFDNIMSLRLQTKWPALILFSLKENFCKMLT